MKTLTTQTQALAVALLLGTGVHAFAGDEDFDIDNHFRAKIAKEKVKQEFLKRKLDNAGQGIDNTQCGSQNIGNVDTNGRPGTAPREVFVFAPNAINLVTANGCH